ncbi:hypothetical protein M422DRAFT_190378, partial [Sphaerobolus stellatus SS14]
AVIKERTIPILIEFVPLTFSMERSEDIAIVENDSRLSVSSIISARWIKPESRRREGQKVAHLIVRVTGAEAANKILRDGMVIRSKRVRARKIAREPQHCLKCQKVDTKHIAATCPSTKDICRTCGEEHRTMECKEKDPNRFKCANYNIHGHTSWGRECPAYQHSAQRLRQRDTEATY